MEAELQAHVAFHLTGRKPRRRARLRSTAADLRPALFARYRDLTALRYDFPLVLLADASDNGYVQSPVRHRRRRGARHRQGRRRRRADASTLLRLEREIRVADRGRRDRDRCPRCGTRPRRRARRAATTQLTRQPEARARRAQGRRRGRRLRRGACRPACSGTPGAWCRSSKTRKLARRPAAADPQTVRHPQGRRRALRGGPQRGAPEGAIGSGARATCSTSTRCRACSPRRRRRRPAGEPPQAASRRCSRCCKSQRFFRRRRATADARRAEPYYVRVRQLRRRARGLPRAAAQGDRAGQGDRRSPSSKSRASTAKPSTTRCSRTSATAASDRRSCRIFPDYLICAARRQAAAPAESDES